MRLEYNKISFVLLVKKWRIADNTVLIYSAYIIEIWNNISYYELYVLFTDLFPEQYQNNIIQVETAMLPRFQNDGWRRKDREVFSYIYRDACIYFSKKKGRNKVTFPTLPTFL